MKDLNIHDLEEIALKIESLKTSLLFEFNEAGIAPIAEQHFLCSLSYLDLAVRNMKLANYHQMKKE